MQLFLTSIKPVFRWLIGIVLAIFICSCLSLILLAKNDQDYFYQGIYIDDLEVGGLTKDQALNKLKNKNNYFVVAVKIDQASFATSSATLGQKTNYSQAIETAYQLGRERNLLKRIQTILSLSKSPQYYFSQTNFDQEKINAFLNSIKKEIDLEGELPSAQLHISNNANSIRIFPGKIGRELDLRQNSKQLLHQLSNFADTQAHPEQNNIYTYQPDIASTSAQLNTQEIFQAKQRSQGLVGKKITLYSPDHKLYITDQDLVSFLSFPSEFNIEAINLYLEEIADLINRPAQDAIFDYNKKTLQVNSFQPDRQGLELDKEKTKQLIKEKIELFLSDKNISTASFDLPVNTTQAEITLEQTNDLGIKERIGFGESYYDHSIPTRIHNVALTAQKINYTLVPPGKEFSFNQTLGEVSSKTGFKQAYVIRNGRTELGDGGGVCQVSTTLFRALLDSGLKITKRKPHSYRVSYYELNNDPGFDATVYAGDVDLRFINDTQKYILIFTQTDSEALYMTVEIYGTSDGRTTEIIDYQKWGYQGPPPAVYIPDPSLPPGSIRQIDWAASGIKAKFTHLIKDQNGNIMSQTTYSSYYRPWSAKYLQGI